MKKRGMRLLFAVLALLLLAGLPVKAAAQDSGITPIEPEFVTLINPLYADIITEADLAQPLALPAEEEITYCTTQEAAAAVLRAGMCKRQETISVGYQTTEMDNSFVRNILDTALSHTGEPTEGDYLAWQYGGGRVSRSGYTENGIRYLTLTYYLTYYTDEAQEAQMDAAVDALLKELNLTGLHTYEKVKAIYDWICANVVYDDAGLADNSDLLKFTAYGALVEKSAVCQGYANLFYRLALEEGIDARLIAGVSNGENHGWNIVQLKEKYYNVDSTWDASRVQEGRAYRYFLKCDTSFYGHSRSSEYTTTSFYKRYPMGESDYQDAGHEFTATVTPPTCIQGGYTTWQCVCGESYTDKQTPARGHSWSAWVVIKAATFQETGEQARTCRSCGEKEVEILDRLASNQVFRDVPENAYYTDAVTWAAEQEITTGTSAVTFSPENPCTRGQAVTFLWRAAGSPEPVTKDCRFADVEAGEYYYDAVLWATEEGITDGVSATAFRPEEQCTRGQIVTFLWRFAGKPAPATDAIPFTDISGNEYYGTAVLWAVAQGITNGYSAERFHPGGICTRGQIVTFLYRAMT